MATLDIDAGAFLAGFDAQIARWDSGVRLAVQAATYRTLHYAQRTVAVRTGATRDSGRVTMRNSANVCSGTITFRRAAVWLEFGTGPHEIRARPGHMLRFEGRDGTTYRALVHHPGTDPRPFLRPAMLRAVTSPGYYREAMVLYLGAR